MWKSKTRPTIHFSSNPDVLSVCPHPTPATKNIPEWYKRLPPHIEGDIATGTVKRCIPVLDAVSQGYIIPLWCDLLVRVFYALCLKDSEGNIFHKMPFFMHNPESLIGQPVPDLDGKPIIYDVEWDSELSVGFFMAHGKLSALKDEPIGQHHWGQVGDICPLKKYKLGKNLFKLNSPWSIKTEKGWSCYFKKPPNNFGSDIEPLEGVVDTDTYDLPVNFPSVWTGDKEGDFLIKKGTPLVQVIPFKRQKTTYAIGEADNELLSIKNTLLETAWFDRYKKFFWHKRK